MKAEFSRKLQEEIVIKKKEYQQAQDQMAKEQIEDREKKNQQEAQRYLENYLKEQFRLLELDKIQQEELRIQREMKSMLWQTTSIVAAAFENLLPEIPQSRKIKNKLDFSEDSPFVTLSWGRKLRPTWRESRILDDQVLPFSVYFIPRSIIVADHWQIESENDGQSTTFYASDVTQISNSDIQNDPFILIPVLADALMRPEHIFIEKYKGSDYMGPSYWYRFAPHTNDSDDNSLVD